MSLRSWWKRLTARLTAPKPGSHWETKFRQSRPTPPAPPPLPPPPPPAPPVILRPFPAETALLTADRVFRRADTGAVWDWRGYTYFLGFARFWRGENLDADVRWFQQTGVNVPRILIASHPGIPGWDDFVQAWKDPAFWGIYVDFLRYMQGKGLRVETTVIGDDAKPKEDWLAILRQTFDHNADYAGFHFVEDCNEPGSRGGRREVLDWCLAQGWDRHGVLESYGIELEGLREGFLAGPVATYLTARTSRDGKYEQNGKELAERYDAVKVPIIDDEPLGFAEPDRAAGRQRTTDPFRGANHYFGARLFGDGTTIHCDAGLEGRVPDPATEPVQTQLCQTVSDIWQFIPADAVLGAYLAPHLGGWPVEWHGKAEDGSGGDSAVNHAYGKLLTDDQGEVIYLYNVASRPGWTLQPVPGWRVDATLPGFEWAGRLRRA